MNFRTGRKFDFWLPS